MTGWNLPAEYYDEDSVKFGQRLKMRVLVNGLNPNPLKDIGKNGRASNSTEEWVQNS
jgi:hypothetical protein